jgi:hypothetical protein
MWTVQSSHLWPMGQWHREDKGEALLVEWGQERWDRVDHRLRGKMATAGRGEAGMGWAGEMALVEEGGVEISVAADCHQENGGEGRGSRTVVTPGVLEVEEGGEEVVTDRLDTSTLLQMRHGISEPLLAPSNPPGGMRRAYATHFEDEMHCRIVSSLRPKAKADAILVAAVS